MSLEDMKVARQIVDGKRINYIDGTIYHNESMIYKRSNERIEAYYHHLQDKEKVLSVIASGDQVLNCILGGSKVIDLFDISVFPKYFLQPIRKSKVGTATSSPFINLDKWSLNNSKSIASIASIRSFISISMLRSSAIGRPTTFEYDPSILSMNMPPIV